MRWFCVAFGTLVVVSTALSRAGSPVSEIGVGASPMAAAIVPIEAMPTLQFEVAELSNAHRLPHATAWGAALFLGLPFLIRRRRERLS